MAREDTRPFSMRVTISKSLVVIGNWTLYEDHPGKPGWIASWLNLKNEREGPTLRFRLQFGDRPRVAVSFLRSYAGFGLAKLIFPHFKQPDKTMSMLLNGAWSHPWSTTETMTVNVAQRFGVKAGSTLSVDLEFLGGLKPEDKFKLIDLGSC